MAHYTVDKLFSFIPTIEEKAKSILATQVETTAHLAKLESKKPTKANVNLLDSDLQFQYIHMLDRLYSLLTYILRQI